ncbi:MULTISPECIES: type IX secretion system protein PorD [unclassified Chryseobacterium]|uniref:type IX secretion system protein PorD n=1 Tax=unclassified Chryseobacterium TaxID=2593645 RepID=UPI0030193DBF
MKKILSIFLLLFLFSQSFSQELLATVQVNSQQLGGSNQSAYKALEKSLRDFINNTSWTGKRLQNFEKIKSNFAIVISERDGNRFKGSIVVQAVRPVFNTTYESPLLNLQDTRFSFDYVENENLIFNERQFSGKNLIDVISFYVYVILGMDADSFQSMAGTQWYQKAQQIAQNGESQNTYDGWKQINEPRSRSILIKEIMSPNWSQLRATIYSYHRAGLDNLFNQDQSQGKKVIFDALMQLKQYENSFQQAYFFNLFMDSKADEIFNIFNSGNNGGIVLGDLKNEMIILSPKNIDARWNKWKQ